MTKTTTLRIIVDDAKITKRALEAVTHIAATGIPHTEIARLTDTTVLSLLSGSYPTLSRPQFTALAVHFNVSRLWLWTGLGPMFLPPSDNQSTII